ncbi:ATP-binding cassette sub-family C member 8-like [Ptychodera flava]|uniref:ATP-binding cassette sub-family C member 8-like n=1 Tax=Ptychodera flava TaxID=63121 RepID=UPI00396A4B40
MCEYLNWLVSHVTDAEMQMNAVERIEHYRKLPSERYEGLRRPPATWPDEGDIKLEGVSARYDEHLDTVLKNATIHLKKGQKIGICGRTGSGKSSLVLALFRMIDTFSGRILIDGFDISDIPLTILRRRLAIIPQDPVLFSGSVRFNLDPVGDTSDEKLWEVLEITQLKYVVMDLDGKLEAMVSEGGENFSVGQRQLFCLARAFLRKTKIMVMDEPTASVDIETDALIRKVVAIAFAESTVLTIAHRVSSILDSDTVLVLGGGEILEYDSPGNLLKQEDSVFSSLVRG